LNPPELLAALGPVLEALRRLDVRYYVGGSIASSAHGMPRASVDADVVAELQPHHVRPLVSLLEKDYYVDEARVHDSVATRRSFNAIHLATMLKVDVFVSKGRPFDHQALQRAQPLATGPGPFTQIRLASPEDIVLAKLEWFRAGGEASERQWTDVVGVLRTSREGIDLAYLETWAGPLGVADLLARALAEAGLPWAQNRP
jgi:hypothetical protein